MKKIVASCEPKPTGIDHLVSYSRTARILGDIDRRLGKVGRNRCVHSIVSELVRYAAISPPVLCGVGKKPPGCVESSGSA